jgi:hypothetical protein
VAVAYGLLGWYRNDDDQQLRAFIFETIGNADIDGAILIANMEAVFSWIKNGLAQPIASAEGV